MKGTIQEIAVPYGMQEKKGGGTYGPALKAHVLLENGEMANWVLVWDQKEVGDELELAKKGEYWNVISKKEAATNAQHDEIMHAIRELYKLVRAGFEGKDLPTPTQTPKPAQTASNEPTTSLKDQWVAKKQEKQEKLDTVYPVDDNTDINLDDIPF